MLAVATFSLGVLVTALGSASTSATPRATELVIADTTTRRAISSFIAAFIYSVVAQTALGLEYYGPAGRLVLLLATIAVLAYVVITLIAWVEGRAFGFVNAP